MIAAENKTLEAARALSEAIRGTAEWRELVNAQEAAQRDGDLNRIVARHQELLLARRAIEARGQDFAGKELVEMIALQSRLQGHELQVRQQEAWQGVVRLLQEANRAMSRELGIDFASNAAPSRGACCG